MRKLIVVVTLLLFLTACNLNKNYETEIYPGKDIITSDETWVDNGCFLKADGKQIPMIRDGEIDYSARNPQTVTYSVDYDETTYICQRVVQVNDPLVMNITLTPSIDTIYVGDDYIDPGVDVSKHYTEAFVIHTTGTVDTSEAGTYSILYDVRDIHGNQILLERIVTVKDK